MRQFVRATAQVPRASVGGSEPVEVFVDGELDIALVPRLGAVLDTIIDQRPVQLVIDLAACRHVDAAGISLLLDAHRRLMRSGGQVTLRQPSTRVRRILRIARLHNVFRTDPAEPAEGSAVPTGGPTTVAGPADPDPSPSPPPGERVAGPASVRSGPATHGDPGPRPGGPGGSGPDHPGPGPGPDPDQPGPDQPGPDQPGPDQPGPDQPGPGPDGPVRAGTRGRT